MGKLTFSDGSTPSVCIVGAGFSGLTAAIKLKKELDVTSFQLFDENLDVGGTWLVNKYPGIACDVQSHLYSWSFEQNPNWSQKYSSGSEIYEYMRKTAVKYDLYPHIHFSSRVLKMEWKEGIHQWRVTVLNLKTQKEEERLFDLVINGPGSLRLPKIPKEFEAFTGTKVHTAEWEESIKLEGKVVGVIGSGASAVQVIPEIAGKVRELHCYQRKPAWVTPRRQFNYPQIVQWLFAACPPIMWLYRFWIFIFPELMHSVFTYGHWLNTLTTWLLKRSIRGQLPEGDLKATQLMPNTTLGCKRVIKSSDYYPALGLSHVNVVRNKIVKIARSEIWTEGGQRQKLDVLILATGFQTQSFYAPMRVIGRQGIDLMASWKADGPSSYYGITTSQAPNHFILRGPNALLGHNSVLVIIECQVNYLLQVVQEMMRRNARRVTVKVKAETEFLKTVEKKMNSTVWVNGNCDSSSWYSNSKGVTTSLWPFTCTRYWLETRKVDNSNFEYS